MSLPTLSTKKCLKSVSIAVLFVIAIVCLQRISSVTYAVYAAVAQGYDGDVISVRTLPQETFVHRSEIEGYSFNDGCPPSAIYKAEMESSLIHDLSPFIVKETGKRFLYLTGISYCVMSPAVELMRGKIVIAFRASRCPYETSQTQPIQSDLVYIQEYTRELRPAGPGYIIAYGYKSTPNHFLPTDGPQDPRAFKLNGRLYLTFHDGVPGYVPNSRVLVRTILWDVEANRPTILSVKRNIFDKPVLALADKNWVSLVLNDTLYFIQYMDPLLILKCDVNGSCEYVANYPDDRKRLRTISTPHDPLRGGTPLKQYSDNYYIALAHCKYTLSLKPYNVAGYTSHIILFNTATFRIVFISGHIPLEPGLYRGRRRPKFISRSYYFPTSVYVESLDSLLVFAHLNDDSSCVLRLKGVQALLGDAIKRDTLNGVKTGPPAGCIKKFLKSKNETFINMLTTLH